MTFAHDVARRNRSCDDEDHDWLDASSDIRAGSSAGQVPHWLRQRARAELKRALRRPPFPAMASAHSRRNRAGPSSGSSHGGSRSSLELARPKTVHHRHLAPLSPPRVASEPPAAAPGDVGAPRRSGHGDGPDGAGRARTRAPVLPRAPREGDDRPRRIGRRVVARLEVVLAAINRLSSGGEHASPDAASTEALDEPSADRNPRADRPRSGVAMIAPKRGGGTLNRHRSEQDVETPANFMGARLEPGSGSGTVRRIGKGGSRPDAPPRPTPETLPPGASQVDQVGANLAFNRARLRWEAQWGEGKDLARIAGQCLADMKLLAKLTGAFDITAAQIVRHPKFVELLGIVGAALGPRHEAMSRIRAAVAAFETAGARE